jgi:hypothetical protein
MEMGASFAEYEASVGPVNKHFHETAETVLLYKEGLLPLEVDTHKRTGTGSRSRSRSHSHSQSGETRTGPEGEEYTHPDPSTESRDSGRRADRYE